MSEKAMAREKYDSNEGWLEDVIMNAWLENDLKRKRELAHRGLAQEAAIAVAAARPDVDEIARAICGHPRGCQLALGLCDQCKDDINVLGVMKAAARVAAVPAPPVAEPIVAEKQTP